MLFQYQDGRDLLNSSFLPAAAGEQAAQRNIDEMYDRRRPTLPELRPHDRLHDFPESAEDTRVRAQR